MVGMKWEVGLGINDGREGYVDKDNNAGWGREVGDAASFGTLISKQPPMATRKQHPSHHSPTPTKINKMRTGRTGSNQYLLSICDPLHINLPRFGCAQGNHSVLVDAYFNL